MFAFRAEAYLPYSLKKFKPVIKIISFIFINFNQCSFITQKIMLLDKFYSGNERFQLQKIKEKKQLTEII
jgi:hypothetical protein